MSGATVTHEGMSVWSSSESEADLRQAMEIPAAPVVEADADDSADAAADSADTPDDSAEVAEAARKLGQQAAKKRNDPQKRIDQAVAKQRDAERKAADLEQRLAALEQGRQTAEPAARQEPAQPKVSDRPKMADFAAKIGQDGIADYEDALAAWKDADDDWKDAQRRQASAVESVARAQSERFASHAQRVEAFKQHTPDFDAVISNPDIRISEEMKGAILFSDHGAGMQYYLGQHPEEADRIRALTPLAQAYEMGKIEMRVSAAQNGPAPKAPAMTNAKPPIKPLGSSPVTSDDAGVADENEPLTAFITRENAREAKQHRRR